MARYVPEISRQNGLHALRVDAETLKRAAFPFGGVRDDIVDLELADLVDSQERLGQDLEDLAHQAGECPGQRQEQTLALGHLEHLLHAFAEGEDAGTAQLIDPAALDLAVDGTRDRLGDVGHIDRLEAGVAPTDQRQEGRKARHVGESG